MTNPGLFFPPPQQNALIRNQFKSFCAGAPSPPPHTPLCKLNDILQSLGNPPPLPHGNKESMMQIVQGLVCISQAPKKILDPKILFYVHNI